MTRPPTPKGTLRCACGCGTLVAAHGNSKHVLAPGHKTSDLHGRDREEREEALAVPVVVRCAACNWHVTVPGSQAGEAFRAHCAEKAHTVAS